MLAAGFRSTLPLGEYQPDDGQTSLPDLERRLASDPFSQRGLAEHSITQFKPSRAAPGFEMLLV